jgi:hypothetical protein
MRCPAARGLNSWRKARQPRPECVNCLASRLVARRPPNGAQPPPVRPPPTRSAEGTTASPPVLARPAVCRRAVDRLGRCRRASVCADCSDCLNKAGPASLPSGLGAADQSGHLPPPASTNTRPRLCTIASPDDRTSLTDSLVTELLRSFTHPALHVCTHAAYSLSLAADSRPAPTAIDWKKQTEPDPTSISGNNRSCPSYR